MFAAGELQRVNHPIIGDLRQAKPLKLGIDEVCIELGVVRDKFCAIDEVQEVVGDFRDRRPNRQRGI